METPQTQNFDPTIQNAFDRLDSALSDAIVDMTLASLNKGTVDPDVAKAATERLIRRATRAYKDVLESEDTEAKAKVLARILAELAVSSTSMWVVSVHGGMTYRNRMKGSQP